MLFYDGKFHSSIKLISWELEQSIIIFNWEMDELPRTIDRTNQLNIEDWRNIEKRKKKKNAFPRIIEERRHLTRRLRTSISFNCETLGYIFPMIFLVSCNWFYCDVDEVNFKSKKRHRLDTQVRVTNEALRFWFESWPIGHNSLGAENNCIEIS